MSPKMSPHRLAFGRDKFILSHGIIMGKGLQFPGTNFVDKTLKRPESTYKTTVLVLSRIWYKNCTRAWSPFPLIIPWKTMNFVVTATYAEKQNRENEKNPQNGDARRVSTGELRA